MPPWVESLLRIVLDVVTLLIDRLSNHLIEHGSKPTPLPPQDVQGTP